ncbi:MAG: hypothetical protein JWP91_1473 [Fibrobacteres bacterium]|nr:hypothetical protein [Fibrobacterota bacterium]
MDFERKEFRPGLRIGLILIAVGAVNGLLGLSAGLFEKLGTDMAGWADKAVFALMIGFGILLARKKIIVDNGAILIVGLVPKKRLVDLLLTEIEGVTYDSRRGKAEIKAKGESYLVSIGEKSATRRELFQTLKERGVPVT